MEARHADTRCGHNRGHSELAPKRGEVLKACTAYRHDGSSSQPGGDGAELLHSWAFDKEIRVAIATELSPIQGHLDRRRKHSLRSKGGRRREVTLSVVKGLLYYPYI